MQGKVANYRRGQWFNRSLDLLHSGSIIGQGYVSF